jgi:hypothetical protein
MMTLFLVWKQDIRSVAFLAENLSIGSVRVLVGDVRKECRLVNC